MTEADFIARFEKDAPMLKAWGRFVVTEICNKLDDMLSETESVETFLKLPVSPRVKAIESAIDKVFNRKSYQNPYEELSDKVGVRFVVLLTQDIEKITNVVESIEHWVASKDRDYEIEQKQNPELFDYQSVHFIVRAKQNFTLDEITVPEGTPCEIQIRSLMQHAYSELTHDTTYKPKAVASPQVKRYMARSMALIETTDEIFCTAKNQIITATNPEDDVLKNIKSLYEILIGIKAIATKSELEIIDAYREKLLPEIDNEIREFFQETPDLIDLIKTRRQENILYRQAVILVVYYLVSNRRKFAKSHWPLGSRERDLEQIFTDLGYSYITD